jgi:2-keto-4-pentenoate hydratase/2-oxohepta-3-ene-1,7-dioic acid hydratase in catechol pathway
MRLCRFDSDRLGLVEGDNLRDVTGALDVLPGYRYPLPSCDPLIAHLPEVLERVRTLKPDAASVPLAGARLRTPLANPGKIVAAPVNYQKHLEEVRGDAGLHHQNPINTIHKAGLFLKATSALAGAGDGVALRKLDRRNDHEIELAFIIGRTARNVTRDRALDYVAGYAIGLDITIRGSEERSLRKSADTYAILGPWMVTADEVPEPNALDLELSVNGETRQRSNTKHMILGVRELIELASSFFTLFPGDVFFTGTPEGVSPIEPGDTIVASIERIGSMTVPVRAAQGD